MRFIPLSIQVALVGEQVGSHVATSIPDPVRNRFRGQMAPLVQAEHDRQRAEQPMRRGRPEATVVTGYLSIDDSTHQKPKGRKMKRLGLHHSTTELLSKPTITPHHFGDHRDSPLLNRPRVTKVVNPKYGKLGDAVPVSARCSMASEWVR
ncbi:hypothetical protein M1N21_01720 [Dehalococcoidia bacterium]|nr:hypothetical protein [Dehalococcoidia bacterium]